MAKTYLSDLLSEKDKAKMRAWEQAQIKAESELITKEWFMLSKLGYYYGWPAVEAVMQDRITLDFARLMIEGAEKIHSTEVYDMGLSVAAGFRGNTVKSRDFDKILSDHINNMKRVA